MKWLEPVLGDKALVVSTIEALRSRPEVQRLEIRRLSDPFHSPIRDPWAVSFEAELAVDCAALARRLAHRHPARAVRRGDEELTEYGKHYVAPTARGTKLLWFWKQPEWAMPPLDPPQIDQFLGVLLDRMVTDSEQLAMRHTLESAVGTCGRVLPANPISGGWIWIEVELTPPIAIATFARVFRLEHVGLTPSDSHHTTWYVMARAAGERYHTKPQHGRWTIRAVLEDRPRGEHGADLEMMQHEGRFPLYPAEGCVTRIKLLSVCPPSPPLRGIQK